MKNLLTLTFIIIPFITLGNSDIEKINNLFNKGVFDEASYIKSIKELGISTLSDEFSDVLELYKKGRIDFNTFNDAVLNLNKSQSIKKSNSNLRTFKFGECRGSSLLCRELFKLPEEDLLTEIPTDDYDSCEEAISSLNEQEDIFDNATKKQGWREMNRKLFIKNNNFSVVINFLYFVPQYGRSVDVKMYIKGDLGTEENACKDFSLFNLGIDVMGRNLGTIELEEVY